MKSISQYFNYLYSLERTGMKYDLTNITKLLEALGNPQSRLRCIHIAGTNGKGATASFAASILIEAGYKTGLFTSPHILKFNERIRINGKCIIDKYIINFLNENKALIKKTMPSFFEVNTAMAFKYFSDNKVDAAVIETGLGGRLDSTNIINPAVSVITQIGIDHTQFLGNTLKKIAVEKLGIVKPGIDVIVSDNNKSLKPVFRSHIGKSNIYYLDEFAKVKNVKKSLNGIKFDLSIKGEKTLKLQAPLPGSYHIRNSAAAILAVNKFTGNTLTAKNIVSGVRNVVANTGYFGRLQFVKTDKNNYILDVSHNPDGIASAINNLKDIKIDVVVFGIMADKDYKSSVLELMNSFHKIIFTQPNYQRALAPDVLLDYAIKNRKKKHQNFFKTQNIKEAVRVMNLVNSEKSTILIIGSFFLVSDMIKELKLQKYLA